MRNVLLRHVYRIDATGTKPSIEEELAVEPKNKLGIQVREIYCWIYPSGKLWYVQYRGYNTSRVYLICMVTFRRILLIQQTHDVISDLVGARSCNVYQYRSSLYVIYMYQLWHVIFAICCDLLRYKYVLHIHGVLVLLEYVTLDLYDLWSSSFFSLQQHFGLP